MRILKSRWFITAAVIFILIILMGAAPRIFGGITAAGSILGGVYMYANNQKFRNSRIKKGIITFGLIITFLIGIGSLNYDPKLAENQGLAADKGRLEEQKKAAGTEGGKTVQLSKEGQETDKSDTPYESVQAPAATSGAAGELKVHFIDVGQADSILVQQGNEAMLIDGGNNEDGQRVKSYLEQQEVTQLNYVIGTHAHEDHIGGLDYVINSFKVGKVYFPKQTAGTATYRDFVSAVRNKGLGFTAPNVGDTFKLGTATCTIVAPNSGAYEDPNDYSIVLKISFGSTSFLLTGDAEAKSENEITANGSDISATVLKVGHHGSRSSTGQFFLDKVNPKYAVISVGKGNDYGHPTQETLNRLKNKNIKVYRTDESGTVVAVSNGKDISFNVQPGSYSGEAAAPKTEDSTGGTSSGLGSSTSAAGAAETSTAAPVATPASSENINISTRVDNPNPAQNSTVSVIIQGPAGGNTQIVCHYKSTASAYSGTIGSNGTAVIPFKIGRASIGYTVNIDVSVTVGGKTYRTQTSFTPR